MRSRSQSLHGPIKKVMHTQAAMIMRQSHEPISLVETLNVNSTDLIQYTNANITRTLKRSLYVGKSIQYCSSLGFALQVHKWSH